MVLWEIIVENIHRLIIAVGLLSSDYSMNKSPPKIHDTLKGIIITNLFLLTVNKSDMWMRFIPLNCGSNPSKDQENMNIKQDEVF